MLYIKLSASARYMRPDWQSAVQGFELTPEMEVFSTFVRQLRQIVLGAVNKVDGTKMTLEQVVLEAWIVHSWSEGVPDVRVEVQPGTEEGPSGVEPHEWRRTTICERISARVDAYYARYPKYRPMMDVGCRPIVGSGVRIDADGNETHF